MWLWELMSLITLLIYIDIRKPLPLLIYATCVMIDVVVYNYVCPVLAVMRSRAIDIQRSSTGYSLSLFAGPVSVAVWLLRARVLGLNENGYPTAADNICF